MISGYTVVIASGKPFSPSTTATSRSSVPRALISFITLSQNFAPSVNSIEDVAVVRAVEVVYGVAVGNLIPGAGVEHNAAQEGL